MVCLFFCAAKILLFIQLSKYIEQKMHFFIQYSIFIAQNRQHVTNITNHQVEYREMIVCAIGIVANIIEEASRHNKRVALVIFLSTHKTNLVLSHL